MLRSIAASSPWWSPVIVVKQASDTASAVLRVKKRASFDILLDVFGGRPHQSLQPSFKALSTRAIFMFRWIRRSFIHKTLTLKSLFSTCYVTKDLRVSTISPNITEHFTFRFWNLGSCVPDYIRRQELFMDFQQIPSSKPSRKWKYQVTLKNYGGFTYSKIAGFYRLPLTVSSRLNIRQSKIFTEFHIEPLPNVESIWCLFGNSKQF